MNAADLAADIPLPVATAAHRGTSYSPERRGEQERDGYAETLANDYRRLAEVCKTPEQTAQLDAEFARYRDGYRTRYLARLHALSRCLSSMITGRSNFPTRRNAKANDRADARTTDLIEYRERALAAIRKALCPELRPIMSGDADATSRLAAKLSERELLQTRMTSANAAIRKHAKAGAPAQIAALVELGFSAGRAKDLLAPDGLGRVGFAPYELTNNNAEIHRLRARMSKVAGAQATPTTVIEGRNARFEDCPPEDRVRIFYPGQPDRETRERLKRSGFRWTPSLVCWQAYRNPRSIEVARAEADIETAEPEDRSAL